MASSFDHVVFQDETNLIDNFIHLLHCAPQYFDKDERVLKEMLDKTVQYLIQMYETFHKHTTALLKLHLKQSYDENDYSNLKEICRIIQQLENDSCKITTMSSNAIKGYQKASDDLKSMKPIGMIGHVQETKLKANMKILLHLLNCNDVKFSNTLENPQLYVKQQSKKLEDQKKKAFKDLESCTKKAKSNATKKVSSVNQKSKATHSNLVDDWVIIEKSLNKNVCECKQKSWQKLHSLKQNLVINLKENADAWEQNIEKCKLHYENEIARRKTEFQKLKELHEQECKDIHNELRKTLEHKKEQNLEAYTWEKELSKTQYEKHKSKPTGKKNFYNQQSSKASELENALVAKKRSTKDAVLRMKRADEMLEKEFQAKYDYALKDKEYKILEDHNKLMLLNLKLEECKSKMLLKINAEREKRENKLQAICNRQCKLTLEIESSNISIIKKRKLDEYKRITEEIGTVDEAATSENNDSIREASEIISNFEEELKKSEEVIIVETKRWHLQNLFQSTLIQLEYLEHRKLQQMKLTKALKISLNYIDYALKDIENYLYTADFFWKEIISKCSSLMKSVVAKNFTRLDDLRISNSPKKVTEMKTKEIDQKSKTFKTAAQAFYKECSVFINECSLTDKKVITARENILKLYNLTTQSNT